MTDRVKITRALLSVSDKSGIVELASTLARWKVEILSTGGTARLLAESGIDVVEVSQYTGSPEMFGGRLKTLHPRIHGGLLYRRGDETDEAERAANDVGPIDMAVINLYPFEAAVSRPGVTPEDAIEQIDVGGPAMIRSAAKNAAAVAVITDPAQYEAVCSEMNANDGTICANTRRRLAVEAFARTALYDGAIHRWLHESGSPGKFAASLTVPLRLVENLRYGENPHQAAAFYTRLDHRGPSLASARQRHGKELSFNNILDLDAAWRLSASFAEPFSAIIKHTNPCGAAIGNDLHDAFRLAYKADPLSAFGSIVGCNRPVDASTAKAMAELQFIEAIVAPSFEAEAFEILTTGPRWKKNVRLVELPAEALAQAESLEIRDVLGGALLQTRDRMLVKRSDWRVVTRRKPSEAQWQALELAWRVCPFVKSNAIVLVNGRVLVGVGAGQMSRVDSAEIAVHKAGDRAAGAVVASDALIPFRDVIDLVGRAGAAAVIQPGGSRGDEEVIAACEELGLAMVSTGERHFRH